MEDKKSRLLKLLDDATGVYDTGKMSVDESVLPSPDKYDDILKKAIADQKLTGIPVADARIADTAGLSRMAQPMEKDMLRKAKLDPEGSRMISKAEKEMLDKKSGIMDKLERKAAGSRMASQLELDKLGKSRMADSVEMGALRKIAGKFGKGLGRKAAGLAIGGPLMLASEMADASEIGISPRDEIIESTEYTPEQKKALLRGLDMKMKLRDESGDVSEDPAVIRAKEIGRRLQEESNNQMNDEKATAKFMERVPIEERVKILQEMKKRGLK